VFVAVMKVEANRVAKFLEFATRTDAEAHVKAHPEYSSAFVVDGASVPGPLPQWWIVGQTVTVVVVPLTPEQQQAALDAAHRATVKADSFVQNFIAMTPAQVTNYINNNVTNLATAKDVINKMALMLLLLARREFGD
jgi:hypothetical protein